MLLSLQNGSALLLHQTLVDNLNSDSTKLALKEIGVITITSKRAIDILERRKDISAY